MFTLNYSFVLTSFICFGCVTAESQCLIADDYSANDGWHQVGEDVEIKDGQVKFLNGAWDSSQKRLYKKLSQSLNNHCKWRIDIDFTPHEVGEVHGLPWTGHSILMLTATNQEPLTDCPDVACETKPPGKQDCLGMAFQTSNPPTGEIYFNIIAREKAVESSSDIIVAPHLDSTYYLSFERLDYVVTQLSVFKDAERTIHHNGSPVLFEIPGSITKLKYIQHANAARGDFRRRLTAELDNLCITWDDDCVMDTIIPPVPPTPKPKECQFQIHTPNCFTPNGDGLNDEFIPIVEGNTSKYELLIFSRWGEVVFKTNYSDQGWDGKINGSNAPHGAYVYRISAQLKVADCEINRNTNGKVILLR